MTKKNFLFLSICLLCITMQAQRKTTSLGIRIEGDDPSNNFGISLRHRIHPGSMLEGIVHFSNDITVTGLYERYHNLSSSGTFDVFYGGGAHVTFSSNLGAGVDGIVGLCYTFKDIPFNISIDWKPALDIVSNVKFRARVLGVSIRYTF